MVQLRDDPIVGTMERTGYGPQYSGEERENVRSRCFTVTGCSTGERHRRGEIRKERK